MMANITTCGPDEHPCKGCGLPTKKNLTMCNLCEEERVQQEQAEDEGRATEDEVTRH